jgi:Leucine-rich repeat (LRR) protein
MGSGKMANLNVVDIENVGVRNVAPPLTLEMLTPLTPEVGVVQFHTALPDRDYRALGAWIRDYPNVMLRAHASFDRSIMDLEFLRYFPTVTKFSIDAPWFALRSIEGLGYLSEKTDLLRIGRSRRGLSLEPLQRFTGLRRLYLEGKTHDIDVVSKLAALESLTLRSITLPDLEPLRAMSALRALELQCSSTRELSAIGEVGSLRYLGLSQIPELDDVTPIEKLENLEFLGLYSLPKVTKLPDLRLLPALRKLDVEDVPGLVDTQLIESRSQFEFGSRWTRPTLPTDLVPNGIRQHAA